MHRVLIICLVVQMTVVFNAQAQFGGGGRPVARPGARKPSKPKVVEAAKKKPKGPKPIKGKGWGVRKPMQFFETNGYLRFRADMFHKPHLNLTKILDGPEPPWPNNPGGHLKNQKQFWTANMRLRLEPILNVHETVKVMMTFDILDNMVMGSTPEGFHILGSGGGNLVPRIPYAQLNAFSATQEPLDKGYNTVWDAIRVKHAWAEVMTPVGLIKVGRMPSHWGLGMLANSGMCREAAKWSVDKDPNPGHCLDADYGDIADRIMFATRIPGIKLLVALGYDFAAQGPDSSLTDEFVNQRQGQPYDLFESDDVHQVILALARVDKPTEIREKLAQGKLVVNYGMYGVFRRQKSDMHFQTVSDVTMGMDYYASNLTAREAWALIPDIWFRLNWGQLHIEFEGVLIGGKIGKLSDTGRFNNLTIIQWGFVFRGQYKFLNNSLRLGLEVGHASGDDNIEAADRRTHYRRTDIFPATADDKYNTLFKFDPQYYVDLIFFRELMGTVYNATYYKPWISYYPAKNFGLRLDIIFSMANEPISTPGNSRWYGIELDADISYLNLQHGFIVGVAYGVFFPLDALNFPRSIYGFYQDAKPAQTLQFRMIVKF